MYCAKTIVFGRMLMIDCPKLSLQPLPYETVCVDKLSHFVVSEWRIDKAQQCKSQYVFVNQNLLFLRQGQHEKR